jgi:NAD(P)-dependent dehydrogenase (short-subunit alcohol dehydrogenase family)
MQLKGKRALVTGASGEIGHAIVARLARDGAQVAAAGRDRTKLEALATEGLAVHTVTADLGNAGGCETLIAEAERALGGLDVLVNGAGVLLAEDGDVVETPLEAWNETLRVNLTSVFLVCKYAVPALIRAGGGSVVTLASIAAHRGSVFPQIAYTASKGALVAMTREMAVRHARDGIRFNAVSPSLIATEMGRSLIQQPEEWAKRRPFVPLGRLGEVEEVAAAVAYFASDDSAFVTGTAQLLDGGISAAYVASDLGKPDD